MQVTALIPVHNRIDATLECLGCLKAQTYGDLKVVVVDDGSTDGTRERIRESYPDVKVLEGDGNLWWTGAMHMGVEHVLGYAREGDFILSLNNDTAFDPDFVEALVSTSQGHGRAMVGAMKRDYHRRDRILDMGVWFDMERYSLDVKKGPPENGADCNEKVNVLPGRGLLIPVEVFKRIGNFDCKRFPHYIADYDFSHRAFKAGIKLVVSYKGAIYSRTDLTGNSIKEERFLTLREAYTNFFSIKSDQNLVDHVRFALAHCPKEHRYRNVLRLMVSAAYKLKVVHPFRKGL